MSSSGPPIYTNDYHHSRYQYHAPQRVMYQTDTKSINKAVQKREKTKKKLNMYRDLVLRLPHSPDISNPEEIINNTSNLIKSLQNNITIYETFVHTLSNALTDTTSGISSDSVEVPRELIETILQRVRET